MTAAQILDAAADERPDWFTLIAVERGMPVGWRWHKSEWRGDRRSHGVFLVTGGVEGGVFKRGKFKGRPNPKLRTDVSELVITRGDLDAIKVKWSAETGKCADCYGTGQRVVGWSAADGKKTRDCDQCGATGKSAAAASLRAKEGK